jgi:hypothetical protein
LVLVVGFGICKKRVELYDQKALEARVNQTILPRCNLHQTRDWI